MVCFGGRTLTSQLTCGSVLSDYSGGTLGTKNNARKLNLGCLYARQVPYLLYYSSDPSNQQLERDWILQNNSLLPRYFFHSFSLNSHKHPVVIHLFTHLISWAWHKQYRIFYTKEIFISELMLLLRMVQGIRNTNETSNKIISIVWLDMTHYRSSCSWAHWTT